MHRFFLNRTIKKHIRGNNRKKQFVNLSKAKSILLLFECEESTNQVINEIISQLSTLGKTVFSIGFEKGGEEESTSQTKIIGKKDINFLKMPKNDVLQEFTNQRFDLLLDLTASENISMLYVALFANATMKASSHTAHSEIFDFILDLENLIGGRKVEDFKNYERFLFAKMIFYLKTIQTSD